MFYLKLLQLQQYVAINMGEPVVNQSIEERPEDIVITGISGLFPESKNIQELENHLKNKKHLVTGT